MKSLPEIVAANKAASRAAYFRAVAEGNFELATRIAYAFGEDYTEPVDLEDIGRKHYFGGEE